MSTPNQIIPKDEVVSYLQELLANALKLPKEIIKPDSRFSRFGLNSIKAVGLSEVIAQHFNIEIEPIAFLDHDTINLLSDHVIHMLKKSK